MRNFNWPNGLCSDDTAWPQCLHYAEQGNRLFYVKGEDGRFFERFAWDNNYVSLERDTTWSDPFGNNSYDAMPYGSLLWAKRSWSLNEQYSYSTHIVGFHNNSCNYAQYPHEYNDVSSKQLISVGPRCWGGDIGCPQTIGIFYPSGNEVHWYALGWGWVAWEHPRGTMRKIWNRRAGNQVAPFDNCAGTLGSWPAVFLERDGQQSQAYGDWDFCRYKASCLPGETVSGVSQVPGGYARTALCRVQGTGSYPGGCAPCSRPRPGTRGARLDRSTATPTGTPATGSSSAGLTSTSRGPATTPMQCQGNTRFHAVVCAQAASVSVVCAVRPFDAGDHRVTYTSGDWDFGNYKVECGLRSYVAGISVSPATGRPHALLCCHP